MLMNCFAELADAPVELLLIQLLAMVPNEIGSNVGKDPKITVVVQIVFGVFGVFGGEFERAVERIDSLGCYPIEGDDAVVGDLGMGRGDPEQRCNADEREQ